MSLDEKERELGECVRQRRATWLYMHHTYAAHAGYFLFMTMAIQANDPNNISGLEGKETNHRATALLVLIIIISEALTCRSSLPVRVVFQLYKAKQREEKQENSNRDIGKIDI
ncbi:hypothetical protein BDV38DRAFT_276675 [Aspergillus pseudotamarii]|uniref:Uncharacterized protein n=1 Tax=Aspergillus pseudotamarii TaxID=132259 RepID=A0A5N6TBU2_ASPPS|nr:uncharacterized protein BDV38DRAFT_276675 [Aspergillus pseudotamarii]KAE8143591.1 hypothetical protein BDV38DRAFT_276675 [Aspergillus pseudotamarii]